MVKYLFKRLLHGAFSIFCVVGIVMMLIYSALDRNLIFASDTNYTHQSNNNKISYMYTKWEEYGYLDYVPYADWLQSLVQSGELSAEEYESVASLGKTPDKDKEAVAEYVAKFTQYYEAKGYTVTRVDAVIQKGKIATGGRTLLFASKDIPVYQRLLTYFGKIIQFDNIHNVEELADECGLTFTWYDPVYGGEKFSPAIIGNGTTHKYLLYCDSKFPYIHQNMFTINLGKSYSVNTGIDVFTTMNQAQGGYVKEEKTYSTGFVEESADDLHSATYVAGSRTSSLLVETRYADDYTDVLLVRSGKSKLGYSFTIGILEVILAYIVGLPLGILMARRKDKLADRIGNAYIIFIIAVPSLAYIFLVKAVGSRVFGLPASFDLERTTKLMYILPIISLSMTAIAGLMKWTRRYMIDQMNSDYVKFARSGGLSEKEIFSKHVLKNALVPLVHSIPADLLFAMTGAIITERVYSVPGAGNLLTQAINKYDNSVIVGMTLFYAILSVVALILGDILMSMVDPRISFTETDR